MAEISKRKSRRRMAIVALASMLLVTYWMLFSVAESRLALLSDVVTWYYGSMTMIICSYFGVAVTDDNIHLFAKNKPKTKVDVPTTEEQEK